MRAALKDIDAGVGNDLINSALSFLLPQGGGFEWVAEGRGRLLKMTVTSKAGCSETPRTLGQR